jgi:amino acid adenylation domain-containing protein
MNAFAIAKENPFAPGLLDTLTAGRLLPQSFAEQASAVPQGLAVQCGTESLTYAELETRSNRLARYLVSVGVAPETVVGLYVDRSLAFVTGALAILKAGGAYLPVDPTWPAERIASILRDAAAPVLVSHKWKPAGLPPGRWTTVDVDVLSPQIDTLSGEPLGNRPTPDQLAYVIYTSGSTGEPKGVEITHANLSNLIAWHNAEFCVTRKDRASHVAGAGFDAAVWEIWPYLAAGASLHIATDEERRTPDALQNFLVNHQISIAFVPTAMAEQLIVRDWPACRLSRMLTGGDALRRYPIPSLPFRLFNNYGPTECTVLATSGLIRSAVETAMLPSIGRPITGTEVHIVDADLRPATPGMPGELCIGGAGVGRGYRNRPEVTARKFVENPFGPGRLYRTGDRARLLSNGEIAFLGRIDDQVKVRGYRIEPAEIVVALDRHPKITSSAVVARTMGEESSLAAYVVGEDGLTATMLREFLGSTLPDYMIPAVFVRVDELPLTTNGKVDKTALPVPSPSNTLPTNAVNVDTTPAAAGDIETQLLKIVGVLVEATNISPNDNFFLIGGHSMLAAQLLVRIRRDFGAALTLRQLFQAPTVAALAKEISKLRVK